MKCRPSGGELGVAQVEADAEFGRGLEQRARARARHLGLEVRIDLGLRPPDTSAGRRWSAPARERRPAPHRVPWPRAATPRGVRPRIPGSCCGRWARAALRRWLVDEARVELSCFPRLPMGYTSIDLPELELSVPPETSGDILVAFGLQHTRSARAGTAYCCWRRALLADCGNGRLWQRWAASRRSQGLQASHGPELYADRIEAAAARVKTASRDARGRAAGALDEVRPGRPQGPDPAGPEAAARRLRRLACPGPARALVERRFRVRYSESGIRRVPYGLYLGRGPGPSTPRPTCERRSGSKNMSARSDRWRTGIPR